MCFEKIYCSSMAYYGRVFHQFYQFQRTFLRLRYLQLGGE